MNLALAVGVAGVFTAMIPSCTDNNETIFIRQIQALQAPDCTVTNDVAAFTAPTGFVDVGIASDYVIHPLVGNQLLAKGDARQSRAEPNRVQLEGAEIELVDPSGAQVNIGGQSNPYSVIATGVIDPTASSDASYGVTQIEVFPPSVVSSLRKTLAAGGIGATQTVHANIKIFGHTLGHTSVETGTFTYPITTCYGCGVTVPADAVDPKLGTRNCKAVSATSTAGTSTKTICNAGQDLVTDCRVCQGTIPLCTPCSSNADCASITSPLTRATSVCNTAAGFCE
jgi:hypothetical protein